MTSGAFSFGTAGAIDAGANTATLTAQTGGIEGGGTTNDITAGTASLTALQSIGSASDPLDTNINTLNAAANSGSIYIDESNALTLDSVFAHQNVNVTTHSGGNITVNLVAADVVTLTVLDAPKAPDTGAILAVPGSALNIIARVANLYAGTDIGAADNPIRVQLQNLSATADASSIYINNNSATLTLQNIVATGSVNLITLGDLVLNSVSAQSAALAATAGSILPAAGTSTALSIGSNAYLLAGAGSIGNTGRPLPVSVAGNLTVSAPNPSPGMVAVDLSGNVGNLVLVNVNGPVEVNGQIGLSDPYAYLRAISNIDNPFIANEPDFYSRNLIFIVNLKEDKKQRVNLITEATK
jgi:hypothetical protein